VRNTSKGGADPQILIRPLPISSTTITSPDGTNYIILTTNWRAGLWRFVE
jgi:hypothetical protein